MDENIGEGAMRGQLRKVFPNDSAKRILWQVLEKKDNWMWVIPIF